MLAANTRARARSTRVSVWTSRDERGSSSTSTALVAVHRPSTLALADRVAFVDEGRLLAVGTHEELAGLEAYRAVLGLDRSTLSSIEPGSEDIEPGSESENIEDVA